MIKISCKEYAANLKEELKELCEKSPRQRCLTVIQVGDDKASNSYVNGKRKDCEYVGIRKDSLYNPCTPQGIMDWLEANDIDLRGKLVTVLGRSEIVGKPLVNMLIDKGATVISCNSKTQKDYMGSFMAMSDIVISAIGKPKNFDYTWFDDETIIIDVGINRDKDGKLCGDIDKEDVDGFFGELCYVTPVPGGVWLLTRVTLLKNVMR